MGYDFQPAESVPLSYNSYGATFPTPPQPTSPVMHRLPTSRVWHPAFSVVQFLSWPVQPTRMRQRLLHKGEVVGSIPTAPTIHINELASQLFSPAQVSPKKTRASKYGRMLAEAVRINAAYNRETLDKTSFGIEDVMEC